MGRQRRLHRRQCGMDVESCPHRALRVVGMGHRRAEHRHDGIADMLVYRPTIGTHDAINGLEIAVEQRMRLFRVERARELGETGQVAE